MAQAVQRVHVVLVPGFVGFDVIGQIMYYAGTTDVFDDWRNASGLGRQHVVLHYFDNFPTASVATRADRLISFLAKLWARGDIGKDDRIALVGHSTGGLDIRKAIYELGSGPPIVVDGEVTVERSALRQHIKRVVFLSVPHYGTNLGEFAYRYRETIQALARTAALGVLTNRAGFARLRGLWFKLFSNTESGLLTAIGDALNESDDITDDTADEPSETKRRASERQARSELFLWLDHIGHDIGALEDLRPSAVAKPGPCPAHFDELARAREAELWASIKAQSYATFCLQRRTPVNKTLVDLARVLSTPLDASIGVINWLAEPQLLTFASAVPVASTRTLATLGTLATVMGIVHKRPTLPFQLLHAICGDAQYGFTDPAVPHKRVVQLSGRDVTRKIAPWDNDGVVNTLSMLWPHGGDCYLVEADHADIIGHFKHKPAAADSRRTHYAYDMFQSTTPFSQGQLTQVWRKIFDFVSS